MSPALRILTVGLALLGSGCGTAQEAPDHAHAASMRHVEETETGLASYYARRFDGRPTASGVRFDNDEMVAAHPTFPFGTLLRVTNVRNGKTVQVRVVDRGPAMRERRRGVIIDLSRAAARRLDFIDEGRTRVRIARAR